MSTTTIFGMKSPNLRPKLTLRGLDLHFIFDVHMYFHFNAVTCIATIIECSNDLPRFGQI